MLKDRFKSAREKQGHTQESLAKLADVSQTTIYKIESGETVRPRKLDRFAELLSVTPEWLQFGNSGSGPDIASSDYDVPVLDVELSAGFGAFNDSEAVLETMPVPLGILGDMDVPPAAARIVSIRGESMEGTLRDREKVVVNTAEKLLVSNNIYAFEFDGELKVKRFIKQFDSTWTISSDNKHDPAYQDQTVAPHNIDQLRIIGRVAGLLARKF